MISYRVIYIHLLDGTHPGRYANVSVIGLLMSDFYKGRPIHREVFFVNLF